MVETTLCYIIHEKKVLMMYRNKKENDFHEGKWNGLGGKIEEGETAYEGIRREVLEESGLIIKNPELLGVCYFPSFDGEEELMYLYKAIDFEGDLIECNEVAVFSHEVAAITGADGRYLEIARAVAPDWVQAITAWAPKSSTVSATANPIADATSRLE